MSELPPQIEASPLAFASPDPSAPKGLNYAEIFCLWSVKFGVNIRQRFVFPFLPAVSRCALFSFIGVPHRRFE